MAILLLCESDQTKYGRRQYDYRMDYANKKDNYPKSVADMVDVTRQFKVKTTSKKKFSPSDQYKSDGKTDVKVKSEKRFAQSIQIICNVCVKPDELFSNCPLKKEFLIKNWYITTGKVLFDKNLYQTTSDLEDK